MSHKVLHFIGFKLYCCVVLFQRTPTKLVATNSGSVENERIFKDFVVLSSIGQYNGMKMKPYMSLVYVDLGMNNEVNQALKTLLNQQCLHVEIVLEIVDNDFNLCRSTLM